MTTSEPPGPHAPAADLLATHLAHLAGEGAAPPNTWPPLPLSDEPGVAAVRRALAGEGSLPEALAQALAVAPAASLTMHATLAGGLPVLALASAEELAAFAAALGAPPPGRSDGGLLPVPRGGRLLALVRRTPYAELAPVELAELGIGEDERPTLSMSLVVEHSGMAYLMRRVLWCPGDRLFDELIASAYAQCRVRQVYESALLVARLGGGGLHPELAGLPEDESAELMRVVRMAAVCLSGRLEPKVRRSSPIALAVSLLQLRCQSLAVLAGGVSVADDLPVEPAYPPRSPDPQRAAPGARAQVTIELDREAQERAKGFVDEFLLTHGLPEALRARTQVVLDELISNVLKYGVRSPGAPAEGEDQSQPMVLALRLDGDALIVELVDPGVEFDPTAAPAPPTDLALEERPIGGLGVLLARRLSDSMTYTRHHGFNHTTLHFVFARDRPAPAGPDGNDGA